MLKPSQRCSKALCKGASMTFKKMGLYIEVWGHLMIAAER